MAKWSNANIHFLLPFKLNIKTTLSNPQNLLEDFFMSYKSSKLPLSH